MSEDLWKAWERVGVLGRLVNVNEIKRADMDSYLTDLRAAIQQVNLAFARVRPEHLANKRKLHMMLHLPSDVQLFGLPKLFSTDRFERHHGTLRAFLRLTNRQNPSRDLAWTVSDIARLRHLISGGCIFNSKTNTATKVGAGWSRYFNCSKEGKHVLADYGLLTKKIESSAGSYQRTKDVVPYEKIQRSVNLSKTTLKGSTLSSCRFVRAANLDQIRQGTFALVQHAALPPATDFVPSTPSSQLVYMTYVFIAKVSSTDATPTCLAQVYPTTYIDRLGLPRRMSVGVRKEPYIVPATALIAGVNISHDCSLAKCQVSLKPATERQQDTHSRLDDSVVECNVKVNAWIINQAITRSTSLIAPLYLPVGTCPAGDTIVRLAVRLRKPPKSRKKRSSPAGGKKAKSVAKARAKKRSNEAKGSASRKRRADERDDDDDEEVEVGRTTTNGLVATKLHKSSSQALVVPSAGSSSIGAAQVGISQRGRLQVPKKPFEAESD